MSEQDSHQAESEWLRRNADEMHRLESQITALREAVEVLAAEIHARRIFAEAKMRGREDFDLASLRVAADYAEAAINARENNPIARAAVEKAKEAHDA